MARRRSRRYYRRKTGKWSSNIQNIRLTGPVNAATTENPTVFFGDSYTLAQNPGQINTTVSQTFTGKNIEVSGQLEAEGSSSAFAYGVEDITYYIMYVPEGYPIGLNLPYQHPEWIMAYKYLGQGMASTTSSTTPPPKIKTRLSRKLNTGDSIIFLYTCNNRATSPGTVKFNGLVRWWTKAN